MIKQRVHMIKQRVRTIQNKQWVRTIQNKQRVRTIWGNFAACHNICWTKQSSAGWEALYKQYKFHNICACTFILPGCSLAMHYTRSVSDVTCEGPSPPNIEGPFSRGSHQDTRSHLFPSDSVRPLHGHTAVKTPRTQECRIKHIRPAYRRRQ